MKKYYLDTSIWLDLFENRNEPNMPKGKWARNLIKDIIKNDERIIFSDVNFKELNNLGYSFFEIKQMLSSIEPILIFVECTEHQVKKARDLGKKRDVPLKDALHALVARDNQAILITFDRHFQKLQDIIKTRTPVN